MVWHIREVTVFGRDGSTRSLPLAPGVNIITGDNSTGKSAIIPIVDYCLGAREYQVPVGPIREYADWFGILLQAGDEQIFVARKEPSPRKASGKMHILFGRDIPTPTLSEITGNTDRKAVIDELSRRLGISDVGLAESSYDTSHTEPPSIRSTAHFLFQPQNVIADKDVLFYKSVHPRHRNRLERVFPYILGAVDADYFRLRSEVESAQRKANNLARQIDREQGMVASGVETARALWARAVDLGLVEPAEGFDPLDLRERLHAMLAVSRSAPERRAAVAGNPEWVATLEANSRQIRSEIVELRSRIADLSAMAGDASGATGALRLQAGRLRIVDLVPESEQYGTAVCPLCSQPAESVVPSIERLRTVRNDVRRELEGLSAAPAALTAAKDELDARLVDLRQRLREVESQLREANEGPAVSGSFDATWSAQEQHLGAIRFFIEQWPTGSADLNLLIREHSAAERQLEDLREELQDYDRGDRLQIALSAIASRMMEMAKSLSLERSGSALALDIKHLTIVREALNGRPERLSEIGGGANHVGYHLCALFALHWFFLTRNRPIPSFLFIDQPSQVYFPEEASSQNGKSERQTDWTAVRNLYTMIFRTAEELEGQLQIIVMDHAFFLDEEFRGAVRRRWRNGEKFI